MAIQQIALLLAACALLCTPQLVASAKRPPSPPQPPSPPSPPLPPANETSYRYRVDVLIPTAPFTPKLVANQTFIDNVLCPNLYNGIVSSFYDLRFRPDLDVVIDTNCQTRVRVRRGKACNVTVGFELNLTQPAAQALLDNYGSQDGFSVFVLGTLTPCQSIVTVTWVPKAQVLLKQDTKSSPSLLRSSSDCFHDLRRLPFDL